MDFFPDQFIFSVLFDARFLDNVEFTMNTHAIPCRCFGTIPTVAARGKTSKSFKSDAAPRMVPFARFVQFHILFFSFEKNCFAFCIVSIIENCLDVESVLFVQQGAYTFAEVCHSLGLNQKAFLQGSKLADLAPWFCAKTMQCKEDRMMIPSVGVDTVAGSIGVEPGTLGIDL
jgi:hypothetical protein